MRINLGCGSRYLEAWINVDDVPQAHADVYSDPIEFIREQGAEISELRIGLLDRLVLEDAVALMRQVARTVPGGVAVSAEVSDVRKAAKAYLDGELDNEHLNVVLGSSLAEPPYHGWLHDIESLRALFERVGMVEVEAADAASGADQNWFCAVRGVVPATRLQPLEVADVENSRAAAGSNGTSAVQLPVTAEAILLDKLHRTRQRLDRALQRSRRREEHLSWLESDRDMFAGELANARRDRDFIERSTTFRVARRASRIAAEVLPPGSQRRHLAARVARRAARLARQVRGRGRPKSEPHAAPIMPTPRSTAEVLREAGLAAVEPDPQRFRIVLLPGDPATADRTRASLEAQTWSHWESWRFRDGCSGTAADRQQPAWGDRRHHLMVGPVGVAQVNASVTGAGKPGRDLILVLRQGDVLAPECLYELAAAVHRDPILDLVNWDDDVLGVDGGMVETRIRPSWSPEILFSAPYLGSALAVRHERIVACAGFAEDLPLEPDALWWDLVLRAGMDGERTARIPRVLSHLLSRCEPAPEVAREIVSRAIEERSMCAVATLADGAVRLGWSSPATQAASIVIPTRHNRRLLGKLFDGLRETAHPDFEVIVVDNGGRSEVNEAWYVEQGAAGLDLSVEWWDRPFNYSAVNNLGARRSRGDVLVFLNDDIEVLDPSWLSQLCGWLTVPGIGIAGMQLLDGDGLIQHGGVVVGLNGFADHLFARMRPPTESLLGSTAWYRNCLAVTGACIAMRRSVFEAIGGFEERLVLCGSDVTLGIEAHLRGLRTVCIPDHGLRHVESATRGTSAIPEDDFHVSYWKYQAWLHGGDPYWSPALSVASTEPRLRDAIEPRPLDMISPVLGRTFSVWRAGDDLAGTRQMADTCRASRDDVADLADLHEVNKKAFAVGSVNWVIPGIDSPFYGGINTVLRLADHLARHHGVDNRFVVTGSGPERFIRSGIAVAFPALARAPIHICGRDGLDSVPPADAAVATLWITAYDMLRAPIARRKFYLVQDFEPMFYPAGSMYALAEESYRLGLYGICNTHNLGAIYRGYGGTATSFVPAVDPGVFNARDRRPRSPDDPVTLFVYARPNHFRNCWELGEPALVELKDRLGDSIRIIAAGSWDIPDPPGHLPAVDYRGLLEYRSTARLYQRCDMGLALTVSEHPSYLPLELMACGAAVVALDNPAGHWLLRDGENAVLSPRTVDGLADALERVAVNPNLRRRLATQALDDIAKHHASWERAFRHIYDFLCDPEGSGASVVLGAPGTHRLDRERFAQTR